MKNDYKVRAERFINEFYAYMVSRSVKEAVSYYNLKRHRAVKLKQGATRNVLLTSDYVIKFDRTDISERILNNFGSCAVEQAVYDTWKDSEFGYLFCEMSNVTVHGHKFYIMPRVEEIGMETEYEDISDVLSCEQYEFLCDTVGIGDLHDENWGFLDGEPVVIDYACAI